MILSKKMKNVFLFLLLLLYGCGFESVYSVKNANFKFSEITTNNQEVSLNLKSRLSNYYSKGSNKTDYSVMIDLIQNRTVKSKNKKGEALVYSIVVNGKISVFKNNEPLSSFNINESFDYQNIDNKFNLSEYEENIESNLISNIANDLIIKIIDM